MATPRYDPGSVSEKLKQWIDGDHLFDLKSESSSIFLQSSDLTGVDLCHGLRRFDVSSMPEGELVSVTWDDGTDYSMKSRPGLTWFYSTSQLYSMMSEEEQHMADHSWVEYWPHPYMAIENYKGNAKSLGLVNQGMEHTVEELGDYGDSKFKRVSPFSLIGIRLT